jgi:ribosomal protein S19
VQAALDGRPFAGLRVTEGHIGLNYAEFVPVLTTAIQHPDRVVDTLGERVARLEAR